MASSSGTSSGSSTMVTNSGSDEDLQALMNERKRKRMISNRESARRSRMRKQKHLDDLVAQVSQLQNENHQILTRVSITTQRYLNVEAENSVLRAQANELSHRLHSLTDIIDSLNGCNNNIGGGDGRGDGRGDGGGDGGGDCGGFNVAMIGFNEMVDHSFINPFNLAYLNQPIMASADNNMFQY